MTYYLFKRGGWSVAVDAISLRDAKDWVNRNAPGADYQGIYTPGNLMKCTITGAITDSRQMQISESLRRGEEF